MQKYDLLPGVLLKEGYIAHGDLHQPEEISDELLLKVHSADYLCKRIPPLKHVQKSQINFFDCSHEEDTFMGPTH